MEWQLDILCWPLFSHQLFHAGYRAGVPSPACWDDARIATSDPCPHCGRAVRFAPYTRRGSYRAFIVCDHCQQAAEF